MHAGEDPNSGGTAANVRRAVEQYGASRIGHGYAMLDDEAVVELVRSRSVHVECCPTSSWLTGGFAPKSRPWPEHPVCAFHRRGVSCGVSTDDPTMAAIDLVGEWRRCVDDVGMRPDERAARAVEIPHAGPRLVAHGPPRDAADSFTEAGARGARSARENCSR